MFTFLAILHIVVSVLMVAFILLQDPKGGGGALGMMGGGSSKSLFGSTGGAPFLVQVTKWLALLFAFTSIYLAALSARKDKSILDEYTPPATSVEESSTKPTLPTEPTGAEKLPKDTSAPENTNSPTDSAQTKSPASAAEPPAKPTMPKAEPTSNETK